MANMIGERFIPFNHTVKITRNSEALGKKLPGIVYVNEKELVAVAFVGKTKKWSWYFKFHTREHMEQKINEFFEGVEFRELDKELRRKKRREFLTNLKSGDVLYTSWGYEQTNVEFYQVIEVSDTGKQITLQEIARKVRETGFMCGMASPQVNNFLNNRKPMKRMVLPGDVVKIDNTRYAWPLGRKEEVYTSSYA